MAMSNLSTRIGARALSGTHSSHPLGLLPDVSVVVLVYPPRSGGRPFRPGTGARAARCSSPIFQGLVFRMTRELLGFPSKRRGGPTEAVGQQGGPS
jgi:hypothetical protein